MIALALYAFLTFQDAYWCPMHLDVRAAAPGKCPICGMDLVPIPPRRLGEYRIDVEAIGSKRVTGLRLDLRDPDGKPVTSFATVHERLLHLFIVSRRLDYFAHIHPEPSRSGNGRFEVMHDLPAGDYMLIADFLPADGVSQMVHRAFVTPGFKGPLFAEPPALTPGPPDVVVDGVRVAMQVVELKPRKEAILKFTLSDAATGAPIADLEPYLGAPAHMLIVKGDLTDSIHAHPEQTTNSGPEIVFQPLMPVEGTYKLWVQFQRRGKVSTASFVVVVRSADAELKFRATFRVVRHSA